MNPDLTVCEEYGEHRYERVIHEDEQTVQYECGECGECGAEWFEDKA